MGSSVGRLGRPFRSLARKSAASLAVIERDFLATVSRKRFVAIRTAVAAISALVVALIAIESSGSERDVIGRAIFTAAAVVVPLLIMLIAPATAAPAIVSEREGGTLSLVLASPVSPLAFVTAKFISRFLAILTLVLAMLPVAAVSVLYGGVPLNAFVEVIVLTLCFAALGVACGILTSARLRSVSRALLSAYLLALLGPMVPTVTLGALHQAGFWVEAEAVMDSLNVHVLIPFVAWGNTLGGAWSLGHDPELLYWHAAFVAGAVVIALVLAARGVARESTGEGRWTQVRRFLPGRAGRSSGGRRSRGVFLGHPILDRGVRGSLLSHPTLGGYALPLLGAMITAGILWTALETLGFDRPRELQVAAVAGLGILTALGVLRVLAATSGSIASERRRGSLDLLLVTPMRSEEIAIGTLMGALLATSPLLGIGVLYGGIIVVIGGFSVPGILGWVVISTALLTFAGALGLRASITARSPTHAALRTFGIFFGSIAAIILAFFVVAITGMDNDFLEFVAIALPPVLPFYGTWAVASVFANSNQMPGVEQFLTVVFAVGGYAISAVLLALRSAAALEKSRD